MKAAWLLAICICPPAAAHPVDEVVQNAYLTILPGRVRVDLELTIGTRIAGRFLRTLDVDSNGRISDAEVQDFARRVVRDSTLRIDGAVLPLRLEGIDVPSYLSLQTAGDSLKIHAIVRRPDRAGVHSLSYENRYAPFDSRCTANVFLPPAGGWHYRVTDQKRDADGRALVVEFEAIGP